MNKKKPFGSIWNAVYHLLPALFICRAESLQTLPLIFTDMSPFLPGAAFSHCSLEIQNATTVS